MGIKKVCDRCNAEINPDTSGKILDVLVPRTYQSDSRNQSFDICVSCAFKLDKWIKGVELDLDATL